MFQIGVFHLPAFELRELASRRDYIPDLTPIHYCIRQFIEIDFHLPRVDIERINSF
jgi:hypothetical protein